MSPEMVPFIEGAGIWAFSFAVRYGLKYLLKDGLNDKMLKDDSKYIKAISQGKEPAKSKFEKNFITGQVETSCLKVILPIAIGVLGIAAGIGATLLNDSSSAIMFIMAGGLHLAEGFISNRPILKPKRKK